MKPSFLPLLLLTFAQVAATQEAPVKTTVCDLLAYSKTYNRKLVEVTGFASHGFEDSGFSSPDCNSRYGGLWMSYGGTRSTDTISTVNENGRTRPTPMRVEGVEISLVDDALFHRFDGALHPKAGHGSLVHATVLARFFAGDLYAPMRGYGHLGCCSLFVIQQVLAVDTNTDPTLDTSDTPEQPHWSTLRYLNFPAPQSEMLQAQREAERGARAYAFTDPTRVALEAVLTFSNTADPKAVHLQQLTLSPRRASYDATLTGTPTRYRLVLSRPYSLSFSAADPHKIAWVVLGAFSTDEPPSEDLP